MTGINRRQALRTVGSGIVLTMGGCLGSNPEANVEDRRSDLEAFGDVATAIDRGYRTTGTYVRSEAGVLGEALIAETSGSPSETEPDIVTYALDGDGTYEPLALVWYVPEDEADGTPSLFGRSFDGPIDDPHGILPRHYYLHVWLFRENPDGMFARYHPSIEAPGLVDDVESARDALEQYVFSDVALDDGYENPEECAGAERGVYGVPFVKSTDGGTDPADPPILRYRLTSNWSYVFLGPEWFRPADDVGSPPELFGQTFHDQVDGHLPATGQPRHYGLHAWLFRTNPEGMFAPYNPAIVCG